MSDPKFPRGATRKVTQADWVTRFHQESPHDGIARLVAMHRLIADRIRAASRTDRLLQMAVLFISALTSGALWILVGVALPIIGTWVGAALSSVVTALTLYQLSVGPGREVEQLNDLHEQLGRSLAHVWSDHHSFSWHHFKGFESRYVKLGLGDPTPEQIRDARGSGPMSGL